MISIEIDVYLNDLAIALAFSYCPFLIVCGVSRIYLDTLPHSCNCWPIQLAWILWWVDVSLSILVCCLVSFNILWTHGIKSSVMTTSGLFPFLAPIVSASSGGVIAEVLSSERQITQTAITSYILWSIGILPAMAFIILYVYNILETNMPPKEHIVSLALPTGLFGYGAFGLMRLGEIGNQLLLGTRSGGNFLQDRIGSRPPFLGVWWSTIFPTGTLAIATIMISNQLSSTFFKIFATVLSGITLLLWLITF
ncbi:hypothetical protein DTO021C3_8955 [Paecilomyces variotii]|nr:hypothetical protein DTO021C3_8955 [Paecilomyces variotii]